MPEPARVTWLAARKAGRGRRVERLGGQQRAPGEQGGDQPADAADVGEGEDQGGHVVGADVEALGHGQGRGHHREVGVRAPLGSAVVPEV